jgi:hypothetical protein
VEPSFTVACAVADPGGGPDRLAVFVHLRDGHPVGPGLDAVRTLVADRFGGPAPEVVPVEEDEVPKTGIGKLRRTLMRERYAGAGLAAEGVR